MPSEPWPATPRLVLTEDHVRRHQAAVWRYLRYLGCDPQSAEDLTQETFVQALRSPPEDRGDAALGRWLRTTALNLFRNAGRRPRVLVPLDDAAVEAVFAECADDDQGAAYAAALERCLARLPEQQRRAVRLRYGESLPREHVAQTLGVRDVGAKSLLRRARRNLQRCVQHALGLTTEHPNPENQS